MRKEKTGKKMKLERKGRKKRQSMQKTRPEPVAKNKDRRRRGRSMDLSS